MDFLLFFIGVSAQALFTLAFVWIVVMLLHKVMK